VGNGSNGNGAAARNGSNGNGSRPNAAKPRVFVAAENRLLREALSCMLTKNGDIEVVTVEAAEPLREAAGCAAPDSLQKGDLRPSTAPETAKYMMQRCSSSPPKEIWSSRIRSATPEALILLIDVSGDETNFLQCIRAGVRGYLPRDASTEDVVGSRQGHPYGKSGLSGVALRGFVPLYRAGGDLLPFRERPPAPGPHAARATT
jgi:hypothetical protein